MCDFFLHARVNLWASQVALVVKNPPINAGDIRDMGLIPGLRRYPEGGHGNPLQYSCLENPMDRGAQWVTVHRVTKSQTRPKYLSRHAQITVQATCGKESSYLRRHSFCGDQFLPNLEEMIRLSISFTSGPRKLTVKA